MSEIAERKICLVTGANAGIGKATAIGLAKIGAKVIMLCRDLTRGENSLQDIKTESNNEHIDLMIADLSSQKSIRQFASDFNKKYQKLDVLINNAGVNFNKRVETIDGLEMTFAVNTIAPFLLTNLLLDVLLKSVPSRVVNVASGMQSSKIDFDNLQGEKHFSFMKSYGQSKSAIILLTYEFARRYIDSGVSFNCLHPGGVNTNIGKNLKGISGVVSRNVMKLAKSPVKGAETSIFLASSPDVERITGKYFVDKKEEKSKEVTYKESVATHLWDICAELTDLKK
ncbi:MAG: SDR family oxidoreductase [Candidatus Lokiarchaeota archaeon]|nr:SDR family oxidoreductase [Candidatus Lokiarchaeota archaeon]